MPKINVYLPDDLAIAVRQARVSVSPICQRALAEAVRSVEAAREAVEALRDPAFEPQQRPEALARIVMRMTAHLRGAIRRALDLAGSPGLVQTEHLLVGAIDEPDNLGIQVLRSLHVDVADLRTAAIDASGTRRPARTRRSPATKRRPTRKADVRPHDDELLAILAAASRLAIAAALEGAVDLGHDYLGCEHLMLGLAEQDDAAAGVLLRERGATAQSIRRAIPAAVGAAALGYKHASRLLGDAGDTANRLDEISRRLSELEQRVSDGGL